MRLPVLVVFLAMLPVAPAFAQIGNPAFMVPDTRFEAPGVPAPNQTNSDDRLFAQLLTEGGLAEVRFGELAAQKASSSAVGEFARRMVDDHSAANDELGGIAEKSKIPLPDDLNAEHARKRQELETLEGAGFDLAYMRGQVVEHQKATQLLIWEIGAGQDGELQRFAARTLPTVLEHLEMARRIVADLAAPKVADAEPAPQ